MNVFLPHSTWIVPKYSACIMSFTHKIKGLFAGFFLNVGLMIAIVKGYCKDDVLQLSWGPEKVSKRDVTVHVVGGSK